MGGKGGGVAEIRDEFLRDLADELAGHEAAFHSHATDREQTECVAAIARDAVSRTRRLPE